ncbi:helix-turn-helix transcriptional regulator [Streptomyces sp. NBC_00464]|uniref:helix-turn-helix domain-containing protein n=1 Tax=Streptomyces sp. NBC_00464 TaxID=2975751 RepID=UPI002E1755BE
MLEALGLSEEETRVYSELIRTGPCEIRRLPGLVGLAAERVEAVLTNLTDLGLLSRTAGAQPRVIASPPDIAGEVLLLRRLQEVHTAHAALSRLALAHPAPAHGPDTDLSVEFTPDEAVAQRVDQIQSKARDEVLIFDVPPYVIRHGGDARASNVRELEQLSAGVRYRTLYDPRALEAPSAIVRISRYVEAGEEARSGPVLPMKLMIVDRELAILPASNDDAPGGLGSVLVRPSPLLSGLIALFERFWDTGISLAALAGRPPGRELSAGELFEEDAQLLTLLLSGLTDDGIARHLGLGRRTVLRRVKALMDRAGASTRMQLGWYAARQGWSHWPEGH